VSKPKLLVISAVLPFPGSAGQQQRVAYKLRALRDDFHITFLTAVAAEQVEQIEDRLADYCDDALVMASDYGGLERYWHKAAGLFFTLRTGLKFSNYVIGKLDFSPERVAAAIDGRDFDVVLYEYWHSVGSTEVFRSRGIPTVLDMHNVLWESYKRQLDAKPLPGWWAQRAVRLYKQAEEAAWSQYDALIAINKAEEDYARDVVGLGMPIYYSPMGTDLSLWPYSWDPVDPPRIAFYGGLGSVHNQRDALRCYDRIMPYVWDMLPEVALWIVGSNPPEFIREIGERDERVTVTGFVDEVQPVLAGMRLVLCPWQGTYGFRSRLIEVMGLGVPVIASPDAVYGMNLEHGAGIFLEDDDMQMARLAVALLQDEGLAETQSEWARRQVEEKYSYEASYGRLVDEFKSLIEASKR
jgi:glycosyltransferase involved in cell wall biosynthesis